MGDGYGEVKEGMKTIPGIDSGADGVEDTPPKPQSEVNCFPPFTRLDPRLVRRVTFLTLRLFLTAGVL